MKTSLIVCLALVMSSYAQGEAKPRDFRSWHEFFAVIAGELDMDKTEDNIFQLAAESNVVLTGSDENLILVKPNLFVWHGGGITSNQLRGASDNGPYYLIRPTDSGFRLLGQLEGNVCEYHGRISRNNKNLSVFVCSWHDSQSSSPLTEYETDGETLRKVTANSN
jgi:hypothetical protein